MSAMLESRYKKSNKNYGYQSNIQFNKVRYIICFRDSRFAA